MKHCGNTEVRPLAIPRDSGTPGSEKNCKKKKKWEEHYRQRE